MHRKQRVKKNIFPQALYYTTLQLIQYRINIVLITSDRNAALTESRFANQGVDQDALAGPGTLLAGLLEHLTDLAFIRSGELIAQTAVTLGNDVVIRML